LSNGLSSNEVSIDELIEFADKSKAICIEALEHITKQNPVIANENTLNFITKTLTEESPQVKWESTRVIGNIIYLFSNKLGKTIKDLRVNAENPGTVVRWSTAFSLGEIYKLKMHYNENIRPVIESLIEKEEKNSVRKIYISALSI